MSAQSDDSNATSTTTAYKTPSVDNAQTKPSGQAIMLPAPQPANTVSITAPSNTASQPSPKNATNNAAVSNLGVQPTTSVTTLNSPAVPISLPLPSHLPFTKAKVPQPKCK